MDLYANLISPGASKWANRHWSIRIYKPWPPEGLNMHTNRRSPGAEVTIHTLALSLLLRRPSTSTTGLSASTFSSTITTTTTSTAASSSNILVSRTRTDAATKSFPTNTALRTSAPPHCSDSVRKRTSINPRRPPPYPKPSLPSLHK